MKAEYNCDQPVTAQTSCWKTSERICICVIVDNVLIKNKNSPPARISRENRLNPDETQRNPRS